MIVLLGIACALVTARLNALALGADRTVTAGLNALDLLVWVLILLVLIARATARRDRT